jgi:hypothetical protein
MPFNGIGKMKITRHLFLALLFSWRTQVSAGIIEDLPNYHFSISTGPQGYYSIVRQKDPPNYPDYTAYYGAGYQYGIEITHNLNKNRLGLFWDRMNSYWGREETSDLGIRSSINEMAIGISYLSPWKLVTWYNLKVGIISTEHAYIYRNKEVLKSRFTPGIVIFNGFIEEVGLSERLKLGILAGASIAAHLDGGGGFKKEYCVYNNNDECIDFDSHALLVGARITTVLSLIY